MLANVRDSNESDYRQRYDDGIRVIGVAGLSRERCFEIVLVNGSGILQTPGIDSISNWNCDVK